MQLHHSSMHMTACHHTATVAAHAQVSGLIHGDSDKLLVVCGPCAIHDRQAAMEYAARLKGLATELSDELLIIMQVTLFRRLLPPPLRRHRLHRRRRRHFCRPLLCPLPLTPLARRLTMRIPNMAGEFRVLLRRERLEGPHQRP